MSGIVSESISQQLIKIINNNPLFKLYKTETNGYLYDVGTSKIFKCENSVFDLLRLSSLAEKDLNAAALNNKIEDVVLSEALEKIMLAHENHKIFTITPDQIKFMSKHFVEYEKQCNEELGMMTLEVTENCNFRCEYCVYNPFIHESREHSKKNMELKTAFAAIDYLAGHSKKNESVGLTFYGGEPLLRLKTLIVECVNYAKKKIGAERLTLSLTTNGSLIDMDTAHYLFSEKFGILVSIDGPQEIHDEYRKNTSGEPTYEKTLKGLRTLVETYGDEAPKKLSLSMVYTPPFSSHRLNRVLELWDENPWLKDLPARTTYPHPGSIPRSKMGNSPLVEDKGMLDWAFDVYSNEYKAQREIPPLVKGIIEFGLIKIFRRQIYDDPSPYIYLNGCCVPGQRKIFVNVDGKIFICEKVHSNAPVLGDLYEGIDFAKAKNELIKNYSEKSLNDCSKCWACRLCGMCYIDAYKDGQFDLEKKEQTCIRIRETVEKYLIQYSTMLEINSTSLNHLADIIIS